MRGLCFFLLNCLYLVPRGLFHLIFSRPCPAEEGSDSAAGWAPGNQPGSTHPNGQTAPPFHCRGGGGGQDLYRIRPYCPTPPLCAGGPDIPYQAALAHLWPTADAVSAPPRRRQAAADTGSGGCRPSQTQGRRPLVTVGSSVPWPKACSPCLQP